MLKKFRTLLVALAAICPLVTTATPAAAGTNACVGGFVVSIHHGFGTLGEQPGTAPFVLGLAGACVPGPSMASMGQITGVCGSASGWGETGSGDHFNFNWLGTTFYIEGGISGVLNAVAYNFPADCLAGRSHQIYTVGTLVST